MSDFENAVSNELKALPIQDLEDYDSVVESLRSFFLSNSIHKVSPEMIDKVARLRNLIMDAAEKFGDRATSSLVDRIHERANQLAILPLGAKVMDIQRRSRLGEGD